MSSKKYNCSLCLYNTEIKFNFNRHMMLKHTNNDIKKVDNDIKKVDNDIKKVDNNIKKVDNDIKKVDDDKECIKCGKILSSKKYLNKHLIICKGVSNPLECHLCHKILANRGSKSHHLKICKGKLIEDVKNDDEKNEQNTKDNISSFKLKVINKTIEFIKSIANLSEDDE